MLLFFFWQIFKTETLFAMNGTRLILPIHKRKAKSSFVDINYTIIFPFFYLTLIQIYLIFFGLNVFYCIINTHS